MLGNFRGCRWRCSWGPRPGCVTCRAGNRSDPGDFGASAAEPSCFLHGGIISRRNLMEGSEVALGDGATAFEW